MRHPSLPVIGLLQAAGVALYITLFTSIIIFLGPHFDSLPIAPLFVLLSFCFSGLVCGSLALGYPVYLAFNHHFKQAMFIVLWTATWMGFFLMVLLGYAVSASSWSW